MFTWTRGQQIVAIVAMGVIAASAAYIGVHRLRRAPTPAEDEFFIRPPDPQERETILVHVSGEVMRPGTYYVAADARVQDAIWAAGGAGPNADLSALNLATFLADGDKVAVPRRVRPGAAHAPPSPATPRKVNINRGTVRELEQLPGIGPTLAGEIVKYRERHGNFTRLEQLKRVPGIAEKKFEGIKPHITL